MPSLQHALDALNKPKRKQLEQIIRDASLCHEFGEKSPRKHIADEIKKQGLKGAQKAILRGIMNLSKHEIDEIAHVFSLPANELDAYIPRWQRAEMRQKCST